MISLNDFFLIGKEKIYFNLLGFFMIIEKKNQISNIFDFFIDH